MNLVSLDFVLFFAVFLFAAMGLRDRPALFKPVVLAASILFYAFAGLGALLVLVGWGLIVHGCTRGVDPQSSKAAKGLRLAAALVLGLGALALYKYYDFFYSLFDPVTAKAGFPDLLPQLDLVMPVGVSFFIFQGISHLVDVHRGTIPPPKRLVDTLAHTTFFLTLLSGPILRRAEFDAQFETPTAPDREELALGFVRILAGLFKKLVVSSWLLDHATAGVFESPEAYSSAGAALGALGYSAQILCDFSGYTDIVLGLGILAGFRLPENFNRPYAAESLVDFWRRWHMSFSFWIRDYLYFGLGGSRRGKLRTYANLFLAMLLGGLWHGAGLNFLAWGFLHGLGLAATHLWRDRFAKPRNPVGLPLRAIKRGLVFAFVTLAWIPFGAPSADSALTLVGRMASFDGGGKSPRLLALVVVLAVLALEQVRFNWKKAAATGLARLPIPIWAAIVGIVAAIIVKMGPDGLPPFIYFRF